MTGGEIRIPRAPGSPGKKKPGKRENNVWLAQRRSAGMLHGGFKSIISILTVYLWELTSCTLKFGLSSSIASSSSSSSQRGVRIGKQNRSFEACTGEK